MNAASLHTVLGAGAGGPATASRAGAAGGGGIKPAAGQGFTPASAADANQPATNEPSAEQVLQSIIQVLGDEYGDPIRGADGTIYMERNKPDVSGGSLTLSYLVIGKLDAATGKLTPSEQVVKLVKARAQDSDGGQRVLVQIGDQMVWQTIGKDAEGKPVVTEMKPASEQEIEAHKRQQAAKTAEQGAQSQLQNRADWQQKIGTVAQNMGLFGSAGQLVMGLAGGPNPYTGKPGAGWISGWILTQRLNGKSDGKLLPQFMQSGPVATALEWGIQAYGMLDLGKDIGVVRDYFKKAPPLPTVNPGAVQQLIAQGNHPVMANTLATLGKELRDGSLQMVEGSAN
ncbi:MAG: hypothetical protein ABI200_08035, partial [Gaiellales bacterium]